MSLSEVPQFLYKMNSNLKEDWIAGGLFINTLGTYSTKIFGDQCLEKMSVTMGMVGRRRKF